MDVYYCPARRTIRPPHDRSPMKTRPLRVLATLLGTTLLIAAPAVDAQPVNRKPQAGFYGGLGDPKIEPLVPLSFGMLYFAQSSPLVIGGDFGVEGTQNDGTYGVETTEPSYSINFVIGLGARVGDWHLGISGLLGARQSSTECPESYLGYQCYADEDPTVHFTANKGGIAHIAYKRIMLGARKTSVSTQALIGFTL